MADLVYAEGTVSVGPGDNVVVGNDTLWSNLRQYDWISIDNSPPVVIESVTDVTHLGISPWQGLAKAGVAYKAYMVSPLRFEGGEQAADVALLVAALNKDGFIHFVGVGEAEPDQSLGDEGQYAEQPSTGKKWVKQAGAWVYLGVSNAVFSRYDLVIDDPGRPLSGEQILKWVAPSSVTFRAGLNESRSKADVAPTAVATYPIRKNGAQFAAYTFAAGATSATFTCAADTAFAAGDVLTILAPTPQDATLSGVAMTLVGFR